VPDNIAAALAILITAMATVLLQYSASHWSAPHDRRRRDTDDHPHRRHDDKE
jgi:hypothetical protein